MVSGLPSFSCGTNLNSLCRRVGEGQQFSSEQLQYSSEQQQYSSEQHQHQFSRRKLEPEDSSYDSDHETVSSSRSIDSTQLGENPPNLNGENPQNFQVESTRLPASVDGLQLQYSASYGHDDVYRTHSETLGQEFAEYVTARSRLSGSRDSSPTLSERLECVRESPADAEDIYSITQHPKYNSKVRYLDARCVV